MITRNAHHLAAAKACKVELLNKLFAPRVTPAGKTPADILPAGGNILGVGYGVKQTLGALSSTDLAVRVYVRAKLPRKQVSSSELVPDEINGTPTDVLPVGNVTALVDCGCSIGHAAITAGTAGCIVTQGGRQCILSNNHVLANASDVPPGTLGGPCAVNDDILQPGPSDGGVAPAAVKARLTSWVPLIFGGAPNAVDAAIAEITAPGHFNSAISVIGPVVAPTMPAALYQSVRKWGRTTNHTVGVITDLSVSVHVAYGTRTAFFDDQLGIQGVGPTPFSAGGDSGSLVVDAVSHRAVGLLFANGTGLTFANVIDDVLGDPLINAQIV